MDTRNAVEMTLLETFLDLYETKSMTQSAQRLQCHPSTISRRIKELESRVGEQLFVRDTHASQPTTYAGVLYQSVAPIRRLYQQHLTDALEAVAAAQRPTLRLTTVAGLIPFMLSVVAEYRRTHPAVNIMLEQTAQPRTASMKGIDVALWADQETRSHVDTVDLGVVPSLLCVGARYSQPLPTSVHELSLHAVVQSTGWVCPLQIYESNTLASQPFLPRTLIQVDSIAALKEAVLAGLGIGVALPQYACQQELATGEMRVVLPQYQGPSLKFRLLYQRTPYPKPHVQAFIRLLQDRWQDTMHFA